MNTKTDPGGDPGTELYSNLVNLIRWVSWKYAKRLLGSRYTYEDFFGEGTETFSLCLYKWKKKDPFLQKKEDFCRYFKTSLFNRCKQIQTKAHSSGKYGKVVSIDSFASEHGRRKSRDIAYNGFYDTLYDEVVEYVGSILSEKELVIFRLITDPTESLVIRAVNEFSRKEKSCLLGTGSRRKRVKITLDTLKWYVSKYEVGILPKNVPKLLKSIRTKIKNFVSKEGL